MKTRFVKYDKNSFVKICLVSRQKSRCRELSEKLFLSNFTILFSKSQPERRTKPFHNDNLIGYTPCPFLERSIKIVNQRRFYWAGKRQSLSARYVTYL